ncbi:MAG: tetratricopeptide repeat protein, partial [Pseudomonadota bacterium]
VSLVQQAANEYALAAGAYEKYLGRFPTTKNSYEIRYSYASCLFYSQRFLEAAKVFAQVRDSQLDNRYQEESAFSTAKAYEEHIAAQVTAGKLTRPPIPTAKTPPLSLDPVLIPDVFKNWQLALDAYVKLLPASAKTPRLTYKAAEISLRFLNFEDARVRLTDIYEKYCKHPIAIQAGKAILATYQLQKDLDQMAFWATRLDSGKCGSVVAGARQLLVGIQFKRANQLMEKGLWDKAASAYLALADANPQSSDADKSLNNAAVCYERSKRFESATKIYERIWQNYRQSPIAGEALWRAAINYQRFFTFDKAVQNFLILADLPRFESSPHRTDAIYNAASILENDQAYAQAAQLFLRYASVVNKPKEAAEAHFKAGLIYEKMNDFPAAVKTFRQYNQSYESVPGLESNLVEAPFRIARMAQKRNDWSTAKKYFLLTVAEFADRRLAPATDAAEFAAHAAFQLVEKDLQSFLKTTIKGPIDQLRSKEKNVAQQALALKTEYDNIFRYKRARWTLAAMYRGGIIYEHFARTLATGYREAPIPNNVRRLGQEAIDIYQGQLDQLLDQNVQPVEQKAKQLYELCVNRAKDFNVSNEYTEEALNRLHGFDPEAYPLLKRPKIEETIE